jgi:hypothetical protein
VPQLILDVPFAPNQKPSFESKSLAAIDYKMTEEGPNSFIYFFGAFKDPEGTEVKLTIMSGLDSSFMIFDEVNN